MNDLFKFALLFFIAFTACDYSLRSVWKNDVGCKIVAALFAAFSVVFVGLAI